MKIGELIVQYLYSNKHLTLQDIGRFTVSADINAFSENEKDVTLPPDSIQFSYDQRAPIDDGLISYIMEYTGKIRPLAASDLESYIMLNKQFLNIGKPLIIDGVGTLLKTQAGEYSFTQAGFTQVKHEEAPRAIKEKLKEEISFSTPQKEKSSGGKAWLWIILVLFLAGAAFAAYHFLHKDKEPVTANTTEQVTDTIAAPVQKPAADSAAHIAVKPVSADSNSFYIVIKEFHDAAAAQKSYDRLTSYRNKVSVFKKDSTTYQVRMPFMKPLSDTARVRDSLIKFFNAKNASVALP